MKGGGSFSSVTAVDEWGGGSFSSVTAVDEWGGGGGSFSSVPAVDDWIGGGGLIFQQCNCTNGGTRTRKPYFPGIVV